MKNNCSVHIYKYSQESRRKKLRKMSKEGVIKFVGRDKTHIHYEIVDMEEYRRRK